MSDTPTVVLVEGVSDKSAIEALAERRGRNLAAGGISLVAMCGATSIGTYIRRFGPSGRNLRLAGLCDVGEEGDFRRGLERAGLGSNLSRSDLEALGFFACVADLEDELIRALGTATVERVVDAEGDPGCARSQVDEWSDATALMLWASASVNEPSSVPSVPSKDGPSVRAYHATL